MKSILSMIELLNLIDINIEVDNNPNKNIIPNIDTKNTLKLPSLSYTQN